MILATSEMYRPIARLLADRLACTSYFNGSVEYDTEEYASKLTMTLIVYRDRERITDVVPVWWEYSMVQPCGEVATDFSWSELYGYLSEYF